MRACSNPLINGVGGKGDGLGSLEETYAEYFWTGRAGAIQSGMGTTGCIKRDVNGIPSPSPG